ncbi:MAG TPA: hypothetical protein VFR79_10110 [Nitrospira sp.]|nr:hypothetical protein [Nitrospira sp.]
MSVTRTGMRFALTVAWVVAASSSVDWAHAQIAPQLACQNVMAPRTTVFFVNGITTTLDDARLNAGKLELEFLNRLPGMSAAVQANCHVFSLNYNPTGGEVNDFFEAAQQQLGITPTRFWMELEGLSLFTRELIRDALEGPMTDLNRIDASTIERHAVVYREQIASPSCRRVLIVPHSQGNLYTNAAYDLVFNQPPSPPPGAVKIVGVATPAQTVPGNGLYRTSTTDVLINAIRLIRPGTLPPNTNWGVTPLLLSPSYSGGHSFIGYLSADPSRTHILSDIESSLTALAAVNPC